MRLFLLIFLFLGQLAAIWLKHRARQAEDLGGVVSASVLWLAFIMAALAL